MKRVYCAILAMYFLGGTLCAIGLFLSSVTENQLIAAIVSFGLMFFCYEAQNISSVFSPGAAASYKAFLLTSLLLSAGILILTRNGWVSLAAAGILVLPLSVLYKVNFAMFAGKFNLVIRQFALFDRMSGFIHGIFDITSLVYYLSISFAFLFFTVKVMEVRRWR